MRQNLELNIASELRIEQRAILRAIAYFDSQGYTVEDVSKKRGHNGYDLLVERGDSIVRVEVKGCSRAWQIPDLFNTEFDAQKRLVADILSVVYFAKDLEDTICLIPRDAIRPEHVAQKITYRISPQFKRQDMLEKFSKKVPPIK